MNVSRAQALAVWESMRDFDLHDVDVRPTWPGPDGPLELLAIRRGRGFRLHVDYDGVVTTPPKRQQGLRNLAVEGVTPDEAERLLGLDD